MKILPYENFLLSKNNLLERHLTDENQDALCEVSTWLLALLPQFGIFYTGITMVAILSDLKQRRVSNIVGGNAAKIKMHCIGLPLSVRD
jgi:hypothetical protein